ncbi:hypothetical protein BD560DRAFT_431407 [Blakeslea trispora]|nr:hypothetical protein BD560DRAFT_431407 [Blakeslea trispora]
MSTFYFDDDTGKLTDENGSKVIEYQMEVSEKEYATHGGAFPLKIKNVGVVGTITVSGLAQQDDHNLVAEAIQEYIA